MKSFFSQTYYHQWGPSDLRTTMIKCEGNREIIMRDEPLKGSHCSHGPHHHLSNCPYRSLCPLFFLCILVVFTTNPSGTSHYQLQSLMGCLPIPEPLQTKESIFIIPAFHLTLPMYIRFMLPASNQSMALSIITHTHV